MPYRNKSKVTDIVKPELNNHLMDIISCNIEGLSIEKQDLLSDLCRNMKCEVLCLQETHRDKSQIDDGRRVEEWAENMNLALVRDPKGPRSFNSSRWRCGYNPDLIFVSEYISGMCSRKVHSAIPHTQHRPISVEIKSLISPRYVPFRRRYIMCL